MSQTELNSSSNVQSVLTAALEAYEETTKINLLTHPLAAQIQSCDSPTAILPVIQDLIQQIDQDHTSDQGLTDWPPDLNSTAKVLYGLLATIGQGVDLRLSPANVVFSGIGVLLLAAKDADAHPYVLIEILSHIEGCFNHLESYREVRPTVAMTNIMVKITTKVLYLLAISTKEVKKGRSKKFMWKLILLEIHKVSYGDNGVYALTMEVVQMAIAETSKVTK